MKVKHLFGMLSLFLCVFNLVSCGDDEIKDPDDAVTLNMLNEEKGKTILGNSDVYINKSNNFKTYSCYIADAGETSGLGVDVQLQLNNLAREVAVVPGHLYQIYDRDVLREFPSGKCAVLVGSGYYKAYVVSPIVNENVMTGATVKYALTYPEAPELPEYEKLMGYIDYVGESLEYTLPKDVECVFNDYLDSEKDAFDIQINDGKLTITLLKPVDKNYGPYGTYGMYFRLGSVFTTVKFNVGMGR